MSHCELSESIANIALKWPPGMAVLANSVTFLRRFPGGSRVVPGFFRANPIVGPIFWQQADLQGMLRCVCLRGSGVPGFPGCACVCAAIKTNGGVQDVDHIPLSRWYESSPQTKSKGILTLVSPHTTLTCDSGSCTDASCCVW